MHKIDGWHVYFGAWDRKPVFWRGGGLGGKVDPGWVLKGHLSCTCVSSIVCSFVR